MHIPVLLGETIEQAKVRKGDFALDATTGSGNHTIELLERVGRTGKVIAIDVDKSALEETKERIVKDDREKGKIILVNDNFANIRKIVEKYCGEKPNVIIADLGWRIEQIESSKYGMSFRENYLLDMRLGGKKNKLTAKDIVNEWGEKQLRDLFQVYGDEKRAGRIAKNIVRKRKVEPIVTTKQLADIVVTAKGVRRNRIHPATKVFQALRITVNDEIVNLKLFVSESIDMLKVGGRLVIISFHSLEDKIVKDMFRINAGGCVCPKQVPICTCGAKTKIKIVTKKPIVPSVDEVLKNPRSRSAKMRVVEKISDRGLF